MRRPCAVGAGDRDDVGPDRCSCGRKSGPYGYECYACRRGDVLDWLREYGEDTPEQREARRQTWAGVILRNRDVARADDVAAAEKILRDEGGDAFR